MNCCYGGPDLEAVARHQLDALAQSGSIEVYHRAFIDLCAHITTEPLSEDDKLHRFIKGMQRQLADRVAVDPVTKLPWKSFAKCAQYALSCGTNINLYAHNAARTVVLSGDDYLNQSAPGAAVNRHPPSRPPSRPRNERGRSNTRQHQRAGPSRTASEERRQAARKEKQRRFEEGLCLLCGKAGHRAAECPDKGKQQRDDKGKGPYKGAR